jgi:hypothetical protein
MPGAKEAEIMTAANEYFETSRKKPGRGMAKKSLSLITTMKEIIEAAQPITGRGVGYKLFVRKLIASMSTNDMQKVYRRLKEARERGMIPWDWIVDESRQLEKTSSWNDPDAFTRAVINGYRREYWNQQPVRVEVWSEKGTVRGVLRPVLDEFGVGFRVVHGFASATIVHDVAEDDDGRPLIVLYVGDWDPSGLCMSMVDLPERLERYDGGHVVLKRISLTQDQLPGLPSFPASDKRKDPRYGWFTRNYGHDCWELDALDPNILRDCVRKHIASHIEPEAWARCKVTERAEHDSLRAVMKNWKPGQPQGWGLNLG